MSEAAIIDLQAIENLRALNPGDDDAFLREITTSSWKATRPR